MEEEKIKSSFELAMEKISGLPELTLEEKAAQKEKEYGPLGTALAVKFMDGMLEDSELPDALARYEGDAQRIVRRNLVLRLCGELRLENSEGAVGRAWMGLARIAPEKKSLLDTCMARYAAIVAEFEESRVNELHMFSSTANKGLELMGISGSALRPNLNENEEWKQTLDRIRQSFAPELERVKKQLAMDCTD